MEEEEEMNSFFLEMSDKIVAVGLRLRDDEIVLSNVTITQKHSIVS